MLLFDATPIIKKSVAKYYKIPVGDLDSKIRISTIVKPRQVAQFFATFCKDATLEKVGILFGDKNHTTVLYSRNEILKYITPLNDKIIDNEINRAVNWINFFINKEIEIERIRAIKKKNREKRIRFHIRTIVKHYHHIKDISK